MKAILMCAGKSTRTYPLTLTRPKPLLKVANRTLLEHNLEQLDGLVDEAIIIIGFMGGMIRQCFGSSFSGIRLSYVEQKEQLGTAHALLQAEPHVNGKFIVMMGDDLYSRQDIERCISHPYCILGKEVEDARGFGVISMEKGRMIGLVEKPANPPSNLANTGMYVLDGKVFPILRGLDKSPRGEYEITDALAGLARREKVSVEAVKGYWLPVGYPWSLLEANEVLLKGAGLDVLVDGSSSIGRGCRIGKSSIGRGCRIGDNARISGSIVMDGTEISDNAVIMDSVIGENVSVGRGCIIESSGKGGTVSSAVNGQLVDTSRRKFGAAIGDGAKLGAGTIIYPGRKVWPSRTTKPGEAVKEDIE